MSSRTPHALPKGLLQKGPKGHGRLHGAALIIVLAFLIILTGIAVAFLSSVSTESASSSASASAVTTRGLADTAVQLTISQIRDATAGFARNANGSLNTAAPVCWASQPGAIRTYDTTAAAVATYKLYSSTTMVDTAGSNPTNDSPAAGWYTNTGYYTDLNAPVQVSSSSGATIATNYPILDPTMTNTSGGSPLVEGFQIDTTTATLAGYTGTNAAAMPVRWLYMLKDGTLTTPSSVSGKVYTFSTNIPTSSNPIVGRIAFWTDDETCKLNINTASEGSFWGTPSFTTLMDLSMALTPPVTREFNRYPGHPASTCLSPVLWSYLKLGDPATFTGFLPGNPSAYSLTNNTTGNSLTSASATQFYTNLFGNITPRYLWGGSASGISNTLMGNNAISRSTLPVGRLYASVDELFFSATNPGSTAYRTTNQGIFSPSDVARLKFFLTTESRAPEVNPLNLPKITMWPVPDTNHTMTANPQSTVAAKTRTLADQTIAFCSTLGTYAYYFTRYDATSPQNDFSLATTPRNVILYNYLRKQMDQPIPGYKGAFATTSPTKWQNLQADQICTLLFDYIRSCINLVDSGSLDVTQLTSASTPYQFAYTTPPTNTVGSSIQGLTTNVTLQSGTGQVIPINISNPSGNTTKGIGRFPTVRSGTLWMVARGSDQPPLMLHSDRRPIVYDVYGNQISSNAAGVSIIITNAPYTIGGNTYTNGPLVDVVLAGKAYAQVNTMHPWTCPPANSINTNGSLYIPQLKNANIPLLSDKNRSAGNRFITNSTDTTGVYPMFDLIAGNANPPYTRSYPTINMSNGVIATMSNNTVVQSKFYSKIPAVPANLLGTYYIATNNNTNGIVNITHGGLPYLTIQNPGTGGFDLTNANYKDPLLSLYQTRMEALFFPDLVNVAPGSVGLGPSLKLNISGLDVFKANNSPMGFPQSNSIIITASSGWSSSANSSRDPNVYEMGCTLPGYQLTNGTPTNPSYTPFYASSYPIIPTNTFSFSGGTVTLSLNSTSGATVQQIQMTFPTADFPTPKLPPVVAYSLGLVSFPPTTPYIITTNISSQGTIYKTYIPNVVGHGFLTFDNNSNNSLFTTNDTIDEKSTNWSGAPQTILQSMLGNTSQTFQVLPETRSNSSTAPWYSAGYGVAIPYTIQSVEALYGDLRMFAALSNVPSSFFAANPLYGQSNSQPVNGWPMYVRNGFSLWAKGAMDNGSVMGTLLPTDALATANNWNYLTSFTYAWLTNTPGNLNSIFCTISGIENALLPYTVPTCNFTNATFSSLWKRGGDFDNGYGYASDGPFINKVDEGYGMFNTNITYGYYYNPYYSQFYQPAGQTLLSPNRMVPSPILFGSLPVGFGQMGSTANPSPSMLGDSWLTLQFSPNPNSPSSALADTRRSVAGYNEAGSLIVNSTVPDHLLLDFFQMPVVDPYPISDPFSTAGKVNMNYQIVPFSYITRDAAMRGVLKSVQITAVDESYANMYKHPGDNNNHFGFNSTYNTLAGNSGNFYFNYPIQATETLRQFTNRFGQNDLFHSPSEICALWLYPAKQPTAASPTITNSVTGVIWDSSNANIKNWWYANAGTTRKGLTGDNIRERPYNYIYPRLTTKSNTYQIHYRVQTLKQTPTAHGSGNYSTWIDPGAGTGTADKVLGEVRGSAIIERYIDPSDTTIPDFAGQVSTSGLGVLSQPANIMDTYYKFRVISMKQFNP